jgi:hypothetical protein
VNASRGFAPGDRVRIKPQWGGDATVYEVVEWNGDRGFVRPLHWPHGTVVPQELVRPDMIETAP